MAGPARFVAPFLFALQELLQAAATGGGRLGARPLLVGLARLGPVAGAAGEEGQLALELLEPAALLIALVLKKQVAAIGAELGSAGAAAKTLGAVLDGYRDPVAAAAAGQGPGPLLGG